MTDEHSYSQELISSHAYSHGENGAAAVWRQAVRRAWRACRRLVAAVKVAKALAWGRGLWVPLYGRTLAWKLEHRCLDASCVQACRGPVFYFYFYFHFRGRIRIQEKGKNS